MKGDPKRPSVTNTGLGFSLEKEFSIDGKEFVEEGSVRGTFFFMGVLVGEEERDISFYFLRRRFKKRKKKVTNKNNW